MDNVFYDEIVELEEVLENKEFDPQEEKELRAYLEELKSKKETDKEPNKTVLTKDDRMRIKRRLDRKYRKKHKRVPLHEKNSIENKKHANKTIRQEDDIRGKGSLYKKYYDEPELG